jgi:pimeloyl-[acyl-carrier protein] methyl ester esterase
MKTIVALPGLHGSAALFDPLLSTCPPGFALRVIALNPHVAAYAEHETSVAEQLPPGPLCIVAESFSGPLAVRLAARCHQVAGLVLCASFITPPRSIALRTVAKAPLFKWGPPPALLAYFLCASDMHLARQVSAEVRKVAPSVLAARAREALSVDVTSELRRTNTPLLYVQGSRDWVVPARSFRDIARVRPDVELARLEAPHLVLQTAPALAWQAIAPFVSKLWSDELQQALPL